MHSVSYWIATLTLWVATSMLPEGCLAPSSPLSSRPSSHTGVIAPEAISLLVMMSSRGVLSRDEAIFLFTNQLSQTRTHPPTHCHCACPESIEGTSGAPEAISLLVMMSSRGALSRDDASRSTPFAQHPRRGKGDLPHYQPTPSNADTSPNPFTTCGDSQLQTRWYSQPRIAPYNPFSTGFVYQPINSFMGLMHSTLKQGGFRLTTKVHREAREFNLTPDANTFKISK